ISADEHKINAKAIAALARQKGIYQRAGQLVRVVKDKSPATKGIRRPSTPRIEAIPPPLLRDRLAANVRWIKTTQNGLEPGHPPGWCASAVHSYGHWRGIPFLEAVVDHPILRHDGTILDKTGYDSETALLLRPSGKLPSVPKTPTQEEARAAVTLLLDVVS